MDIFYRRRYSSVLVSEGFQQVITETTRVYVMILRIWTLEFRSTTTREDGRVVYDVIHVMDCSLTPEYCSAAHWKSMYQFKSMRWRLPLDSWHSLRLNTISAAVDRPQGAQRLASIHAVAVMTLSAVFSTGFTMANHASSYFSLTSQSDINLEVMVAPTILRLNMRRSYWRKLKSERCVS